MLINLQEEFSVTLEHITVEYNTSADRFSSLAFLDTIIDDIWCLRQNQWTTRKTTHFFHSACNRYK